MKALTSTELRTLIRGQSINISEHAREYSKTIMLEKARRLLELIEELPEI